MGLPNSQCYRSTCVMGRAEEAGLLAGSTLMARHKMVGPRRRERTGRRQGEEDMPSVNVWINRRCLLRESCRRVITLFFFGCRTCHHSSPSHITKATWINICTNWQPRVFMWYKNTYVYLYSTIRILRKIMGTPTWNTFWILAIHMS